MERKKQDLWFPNPITVWEFNYNASALLVACDTDLYCWRYDTDKDEYMLTWYNGNDTLLYKADFTCAQGLSEFNAQLVRQNNAIFSEEPFPDEDSFPKQLTKSQIEAIVNWLLLKKKEEDEVNLELEKLKGRSEDLKGRSEELKTSQKKYKKILDKVQDRDDRILI